MFKHHLTNKQILEELDKKVFGHTKAKKVLINSVNRSRARYKQIYEKYLHPDDAMDIRNVMLIGASGTGKTFLIKVLEEIAGMPVIYVDASHIQPAGNQGAVSVSKIIKDVTQWCNRIANASDEKYSSDEIMCNMVVFLDEFDKLATYYDGNSGNWLRHTQTQLLTLLENKNELKGVTFILAGAFSGLFNKKKKQKSEVNIGFVENKKTDKDQNKDIDQEIIDFGFIPELIGRIHTIVELDELTFDNYKSILIDKLLPNFKRDLEEYNVTFPDLTEDQIKELIDIAMESGQGVRMLKKQLQIMADDLEFNYDDNEVKLQLELL